MNLEQIVSIVGLVAITIIFIYAGYAVVKIPKLTEDDLK